MRYRIEDYTPPSTVVDPVLRKKSTTPKPPEKTLRQRFNEEVLKAWARYLSTTQAPNVWAAFDKKWGIKKEGRENRI